MDFSSHSRPDIIKQLKEQQLDLLIIGGGITGAGVALQSAASGLKTGLIEMQDFSEGTSSRSTKLVHGGIRYLKQFQVEVVHDTVTERAVIQQIAPHIPRAEKMVIPIYDEEGASFTPLRLRVAMDLYDLLAGLTHDEEFGNHLLSKEEVLERFPNLEGDQLVGGGEYLDFSNSDIRLVIENIKRAHEEGAYLASHVKAVGYLYDEEGKVVGVQAKDEITGESLEINSRVVINTTGPWSDQTRNLSTPSQAQTHQMRPTKGVHLVVDRSLLPVDQPIYFDSGHKDGRMIFVIPRENKTYFGTTDTDYQGDFTHPQVTQSDLDYLLFAVNNRFPEADLSIDQIEASWAGLRPLISNNQASDYNGGNSGKITDDSFDALISSVKGYMEGDKNRTQVEQVVQNLQGSLSEQEEDPSQVSRGSQLDVDEDGLITLAGGKITDYRKMAEGALDQVKEILAHDFDRKFKKINSKTLPLSGGEINPSNVDEELDHLAHMGGNYGLSLEDANYLANYYGSNAPKVFAYADQVEKIDGLNIRQTLMLVYALNHEMVLTPSDFFIRRTNYLLFKRDELDQIKEPVIQYMATYFGWDDEETQRHRETLEQEMAESDLSHLR